MTAHTAAVLAVQHAGIGIEKLSCQLHGQQQAVTQPQIVSGSTKANWQLNKIHY